MYENIQIECADSNHGKVEYSPFGVTTNVRIYDILGANVITLILVMY